jgi:hypothetical protein
MKEYARQAGVALISRARNNNCLEEALELVSRMEIVEHTIAETGREDRKEDGL